MKCQTKEITATTSNAWINPPVTWNTSQPKWAEYHPHVAQREGRKHNTIYVSAEAFTVGGACKGVAGAGAFGRYDDRLRLTAPGRSRSVWSLPGWFYPSTDRVPLGYHEDLRRWSRVGDRAVLRTVARGQEFVLDVEQYPGGDPVREGVGDEGPSCRDGVRINVNYRVIEAVTRALVADLMRRQPPQERRSILG
jgi:hypothetical protein